MTRKTFMTILRVVAVVIFVAVLAPRLVEFTSQPVREQTVIGYSTNTVQAVVTAVLDEGVITLGDIEQAYQVVQATVIAGEYSGETFDIEYGTRQIRTDMIPLAVGDQIMITVSTMPDGSLSAFFTDFYRGRSLVGSLGLLTSVPITTALAAVIAVNYRFMGNFKTYLGPLNEQNQCLRPIQ